MKKRNKFLVLLLAALLLVVSGCSKKTETKTNTDTKTEKKVKPLRLGVMAAADSAPILLAQEKGYFKDQGVDLKLEVFTNGSTKQSSIQAGELDGAMVAMFQFFNNVNGGLKAKMTSATDGSFPVVISKQYKGGKDIKVGSMQFSVVDYLADKYLKDYKMEKVYINDMTARLQALMQGSIDMSVLPEPLASKAQLKGLEKKVYGKPNDFTPDCLIFTDAYLKSNKDTVKGFYKAYNKAVRDIKKNPELAKDVLAKQLKFDDAVKKEMALPNYHEARVPSDKYVDSLVKWMNKNSKRTVKIDPAKVIDSSFIK